MEKTNVLVSDYISLDTLGFAQLSDMDYGGKIQIEKKVITSFFSDTPTLAIPLAFLKVAKFYWKLCPHDFGTYWDFTIAYNRNYIDDLETLDFESYVLFWEWVDRCQNALSEYETELITKCNIEYEKPSI